MLSFQQWNICTPCKADLGHFTSHDPKAESWTNLGQNRTLEVSSTASDSKQGICMASSSWVLNNDKPLSDFLYMRYMEPALSWAEQAQLSQLLLLCDVLNHLTIFMALHQTVSRLSASLQNGAAQDRKQYFRFRSSSGKNSVFKKEGENHVSWPALMKQIQTFWMGLKLLFHPILLQTAYMSFLQNK